MSADRIAAQLARQPGLGSAGPAAMPASTPQAAPAIVTLLPGICADIHLGVNCPAASAVTGTASMPHLRGSAKSSWGGCRRANDPVDRVSRAHHR